MEGGITALFWKGDKMSKSAIYAVNTTVGTTVDVGEVIPVDTVVRRFGSNLSLVNDAIVLKGAGYYSVSASVTLSATIADEISVALYQDGRLVPGTKASVTMAAANDVATLSIDALVRVIGCNENSVLTLVVSDQAVGTVDVAIVVEKK